MPKKAIEWTYYGHAVSGKNQQRTAMIRGRLVRFPNKRFKDWRASFQAQALSAAVRCAPLGLARARQALFESGEVSITVLYWRADNLRRDTTGILDAIYHASEFKNGGVFVTDDSQFAEVHFMPMGLDRERPRMEILIKERA